MNLEFPRFPHCKIPLFPLYILFPLQKSYYAQPTLKQWKSSPWIIFKVLCVTDLFLLPDLLFNHLFMSVWSHTCFKMWLLIQYDLIYFIVNVALALVIESYFSWLLCLFYIFCYYGTGFFILFCFVSFLKHSLLSGNIRWTIFALYISLAIVESVIYKSHGSFVGE